jgi:HTH-type transcriptional regulator / antitoxin HigA
MTTTTAPLGIQHPGFFIKEEMEERGWIQRDLAFILAVPEQSITQLLLGKKGVTPEMALQLGAAFDVAPEFFANLQLAFDMSQARKPDPSVAVRASLQSIFPVREMIRRGWIENSDADLLEAQLVDFFKVNSSSEIPYLAHAAKKSRYEERDIPPAQLAWLFRIKQLAESVASRLYSEKELRAALPRLESLMVSPEAVREVPRILMDCGVRYVVAEKLTGANIDGVCFWIGDSPVIGMSLQRDKIDNFWFVLRHEIEHVLRRDGRNDEIIDVLEGERASSSSDSIPAEERAANTAAQNFCVPSERMESFILRKSPFFYEKDVLAFAQITQRHPGMVVGQIQRHLNRWDYLVRHQAKVRQFLLPGAIADGWGQSIPVGT